VKIQRPDRQRVSLDVTIELTLGIAAKRFVDQSENDPGHDDQGENNDDDPS
jgi:hypothetical protein